jgi:hypothetical protein
MFYFLAWLRGDASNLDLTCIQATYELAHGLGESRDDGPCMFRTSRYE